MVILLVGARAFAVQGLAQTLEKKGHQVYSAKSSEIASCGVSPDIVVNFSIQARAGLEELDKFMIARRVPRLVQVSSLSVYRIYPAPRNGYAAAKIAQDAFFRCSNRPYRVQFIRPGVLFTADKRFNSGGIAVRISKHLFPLSIVLGGRKTPLCICSLEAFHGALVDMIENPPRRQVKIVGEWTTKLAFARFLFGSAVLPLPECIISIFARLMPRETRFRILSLFHRPRLKRHIEK